MATSWISGNAVLWLYVGIALLASMLAVARVPAKCRRLDSSPQLTRLRFAVGMMGAAVLAGGVYGVIAGFVGYSMLKRSWGLLLPPVVTGVVLALLGLSFLYCSIERLWTRFEGGRDEQSKRASNRRQRSLGWMVLCLCALWTVRYACFDW